MSPVHTDNDGWGFDMSPVHIGAQPEEGVQSYDLSPLDKVRGALILPPPFDVPLEINRNRSTDRCTQERYTKTYITSSPV